MTTGRCARTRSPAFVQSFPGAPPIAPATCVAAPRAAMVVDAVAVDTLRRDPRALILDARVTERFADRESDVQRSLVDVPPREAQDAPTVELRRVVPIVIGLPGRPAPVRPAAVELDRDARLRIREIESDHTPRRAHRELSDGFGQAV